MRKKAIPYEQRIGEKHNMLTILKITGKENSGKRTKIRCIVRCECGSEKDVRIEGVVNGQQYSCGCARKKFKNPFRKKYMDYKNSAKNRGYTFNLSESEFNEFYSGDCHYCGVKNANGIDRKDNDKGYDVENSLSCCGTCNRGKRDMSYDEYIDYLDRLVMYRNGNQERI